MDMGRGKQLRGGVNSVAPASSWASLVRAGTPRTHATSQTQHAQHTTKSSNASQTPQAQQTPQSSGDGAAPPAPILELKTQGGRVMRLVDLDDITRREMRAVNQWRPNAAAHTRSTHGTCTALDLPVEIWSYVFSYLSEARDLCSASLSCHLFHAALTDRRCWAMARVPVYNPEWIQEPGCEFAFLQPNESLHAFGFRYIPEDKLVQLRRHNIHRIILQGPNILRQPAHIQQLTCELPNLTEITFFCAAVSSEAISLLHKNCASLTTLRVVYWGFEAVLRLTALKKLTCLYLEQCVGISQLQILSLCRNLPNLKKLFILGCDGVDMDVLKPISKAHTNIKIMWAPQSQMFSMWHFRRAWPTLPANGFCT